MGSLGKKIIPLLETIVKQHKELVTEENKAKIKDIPEFREKIAKKEFNKNNNKFKYNNEKAKKVVFDIEETKLPEKLPTKNIVINIALNIAFCFENKYDFINSI